MTINRVCVYCASSSKADAMYSEAAYRLGQLLAQASITTVYGGSSSGSMGQLANGALDAGGRVIGIMPHFMNDVEWGHKHLSEMQLVDDMHTRKRLLLEGADAVVALPGGSGTFEELFEVITLKRLGMYLGPIIFVNTKDYFNLCLQLLEQCVSENFMDKRHLAMWQVVETPDQVLEAIANAPIWSEQSSSFAAIR